MKAAKPQATVRLSCSSTRRARVARQAGALSHGALTRLLETLIEIGALNEWNLESCQQFGDGPRTNFRTGCSAYLDTESPLEYAVKVKKDASSQAYFSG